LWRTDAEPDAAFQQAFGVTHQTLEHRLRGYAMSNDYREQTIGFGANAEPNISITSAPLTHAGALARLGDLLLRAERFDDAESRLNRALTLEPTLAQAHVSLGLLRLRQQRFADARASLEAAIRLNESDHLAHYYFADALNRDTSDADATVSGYAERTSLMRRELQRAITLAPDFLNAYRLLAEIEIRRGTQLDETAALISRALTLAPSRADFALLRARLYMRAENYTQGAHLTRTSERVAACPALPV
jgi:tetratricopeptide (TPR) repeat protein